MADTFDEIRRFEEMMDRMFDEFWGRPRRRLLPSGRKGEIIPAEYREPFIDVIETDGEIIAAAEMPGLEKKDIKINISEDRLEISAEAKEEKEREEKGYVYRERCIGNYYRAVSLPSTVNPDNSKATYRNGVLEIRMPKTEIKKKKPLEIE